MAISAIAKYESVERERHRLDVLSRKSANGRVNKVLSGAAPYIAQWAEASATPTNSANDFDNPDTSTYNKNTEDSDT